MPGRLSRNPQTQARSAALGQDLVRRAAAMIPALQVREAQTRRTSEVGDETIAEVKLILDDLDMRPNRDLAELADRAERDDWPLERRAELGASTATTVSRCATAIDKPMLYSGGKAVCRGNVIQNAFLDIRTARAAVANNPFPCFRNLGAMSLGYPSDAPDLRRSGSFTSRPVWRHPSGRPILFAAAVSIGLGQGNAATNAGGRAFAHLGRHEIHKRPHFREHVAALGEQEV